MAEGSACDEYLRSVDVCLIFTNGEVLLISEREADQLLRIFFELASSSLQGFISCTRGQPVRMTHLVYIRQHHTTPSIPVKRLCPLNSAPVGISDEETLAAIQLFNGETTYATESRRRHLKNLVGNHGSEPGKIVHMRGYLHQMAFSDLEKTCERSLRRQGMSMGM